MHTYESMGGVVPRALGGVVPRALGIVVPRALGGVVPRVLGGVCPRPAQRRYAASGLRLIRISMQGR